jgi:hypothetical protein
LEASAIRPPTGRARRHRFADIRDTRNRFATSWLLASASIISAAASRTLLHRHHHAETEAAPRGNRSAEIEAPLGETEA